MALLAVRIKFVDWVVLGIGIEIHAVFGADGVGLHEPAERRRVEAGLEVVEAATGRCAAGGAQLGRNGRSAQ